MAGANQIPKFALWNRENQLSPLSAIGPTFYQRVAAAITASPITATQLVSDLLLTAATPNALAGPSAVDLCTYFQSLAQDPTQGLNPTAIGSRFMITVQNSDPVNSKVITFGANVTPATMTFLPNTTTEIGWELTSLSPQTWSVWPPSLAASGVAGAVTSWQQSTAADLIPPIAGEVAGPRVGAVVGLPGDYAASDIKTVPFGTIAATTVQAALQEIVSESVLSFQQSAAAAALAPIAGEIAGPRVGAVVALPGDYAASNIKTVTSATLVGTTAQLQITELDTEKVTLRDNTGARVAAPAGATAIQDILVAIGAGDNYVPSETIRAGRIGCLSAGQAAGVVDTALGFVIEAIGSGLIPANGLIAAELQAAGNPNAGYGLVRVDSQLFATFGNLVRQANVRSIVNAALPTPGHGAFGGPGAYHIECDTAGAVVFWVNNLGNCGFQSSGVAGANNVERDANGELTIVPSLRSTKKNIEDIGGSNDWFYKVRPRRFEYIKGPDNYPRYGAVIEELQEIGAPPEVYGYESSGKKDGQLDYNRPSSIYWNAFTVVLIQEVQKLRADVEALKKRVSEFE